MLKKEIIWRYILEEFLKHKKTRFLQSYISKKFNFSLSTVFNALKIPRKIGAIEVSKKGINLIDFEKLLILWATHRDLQKDIIYKTFVEMDVKKIEAFMPQKIIFTAYSGIILRFKEAPSDYDKVYVYAEKNTLSEIKKRFAYKKGYFNLIVLKKDGFIEEFSKDSTAPLTQIFVDLWNLKEWYAKEFINLLKEKLNLK